MSIYCMTNGIWYGRSQIYENFQNMSWYLSKSCLNMLYHLPTSARLYISNHIKTIYFDFPHREINFPYFYYKTIEIHITYIPVDVVVDIILTPVDISVARQNRNTETAPVSPVNAML